MSYFRVVRTVPRELYSDICLEFRHIHAHAGHLFTVLVRNEWRRS